MCSRYSLTSYLQGLQEYFAVEFPQDYKPRYNIAPQQESLIITSEEPTRAQYARFGLLPHWSKNPSSFSLNARAETLNKKPTFKTPFQKKRCLVLADGFYEWKDTPGGKQPYRFTKTDEGLFAFAGLYDDWKNEEQQLRSYCIITTTPNETVKPIHDRMPVLLNKQNMYKWLAKIPSSEHLTLLRSYPETMKSYPVSKALNNARNDEPQLVNPIMIEKNPQRSLGEW